jgi:hypothetical protein
MYTALSRDEPAWCGPTPGQLPGSIAALTVPLPCFVGVLPVLLSHPAPHTSFATSPRHTARASTDALPHPSRRAVLAAAAASALLRSCGAASPAAATSTQSPPTAPIGNTLSAARTALGTLDSKIADARWDGVRTVLAAAPLATVRKTAGAAANGLPEDLRAPFLGAAEDLATALRLLDGVVYGNVFIGEDRQILGTKVDFDTPRIYLADAKEALEFMAEIIDAGGL